MTELARGANAPLSGAALDIAVAGARQGAVDLLVLQLTSDRKVRTDADLVFFNQPTSPEGAVQLSGGDHVRIDLARVPADIEVLAVTVSVDDSLPDSLSAISGLGVTVSDGGSQVSASAGGLTTERAALLVEIYRRAGAWKVRNVSAGWNEGLAALVREHGVEVADEQPSAGEPRSVAGEEKLSLEKRQKLDMRKREVAKVLLTKNAGHARARVVLVIDKTGSMQAQYRKKVVHRVVERMVPVAIQLDDDGMLECYLYARKFIKLPDLQVADMERWPEEYLHLFGKHGGFDYDAIGASNDEIPIMNELLSTLSTGDKQPTLVLFFTDGGFSKKQQITELITKASTLPAFWQFVGIGKANYGLLERLDDLAGRAVDNVGFFALDDIDQVDDAELYRRLLSEFPDWLGAARSAGILR